MLNRSLLFLALTLQISFTASNVNAANDLEKWNSEVGRTVRQTHSDKLAQTTYKEMSSKAVNVAQDMKTVYPQIETQAQVAGSRTRVVAEAVLEVDKNKVWKDWARKIGKFGKGANAVGGALVIGGLIVDAAGWVIDEGGKINKRDTGGSFGLLTSYSGCSMAGRFPSYGAITAAYAACGHPVQNCTSTVNSYGWTHYTCGSTQFMNYATPTQITQPVTEQEIENTVRDFINNPNNADAVRDMIGNTYSMGPDNPEPDPSVVNDLKNAQKDVLKSDNPKGDGKTRTDPKIDTGTQGQADTTPKPDPTPNPNPNPDPNPSPDPNPNTGSTTTFELPPFCVYAAIVCDWIEWTKEKPEEEESEEEEDINDKGIFDRTFDLDFSLGGQCPPNLSWSMNNKYLSKTFEIDLSWACMFFTAIGYALLFLSNCIGIWVMYETVVRKELKW